MTRKFDESTDWNPVGAIRPQAAEYYASLFVKRYPDLAEKCDGRLARAIHIMATPGACRRGDLPVTYLVQSGSNPHAWYTVDPGAKTCTCPDAAKGNLCKHRLAIGIKLNGPDWAMEEARAREARLYEKRQEINAAWRRQNEACTIFEAWALDMIDPDPEDIKVAEARMLQLTEECNRLEDEYQALVNEKF